MVLFNDTQPEKPKSLFRQCLKWTFRILLFLIVIILVCIGCLNMLQGTGQTQKNGIQKTIESFTGKQTQIRKLEAFQFFPEFHVAFKGLENGLFSEKQIKAYSVNVRAPGAMVFTRNGLFRELEIHHLEFLKDSEIIHHIENVSIVPEPKTEPKTGSQAGTESAPPSARLVINFNKPQDLKITFTLSNGPDYKFSKDAPFVITWPEGRIEGHLMNNDNTRFVTGKASLNAPLGTLPVGNIECFFAELSMYDYKLAIHDLWAVASGLKTVAQFPAIDFDAFNASPISKDLSTRLPAAEIKQSACAPFLQDSLTR